MRLNPSATSEQPIEDRLSGGALSAALAWLGIVLVCAAQLALLLVRGTSFVETDVLTLLPENVRSPDATRAIAGLAKSATPRVIVLVQSSSWVDARTAAQDISAQLQDDQRWALDNAGLDPSRFIDYYLPYASGLASRAGLQTLQQQPVDRLARTAATALLQPGGVPRLTRWQDDPLNLFGGWLIERAQTTKVRITDGWPSVALEQQTAALLLLHMTGSAFSIGADTALNDRLAALALGLEQRHPGVTLRWIGIPVFAATNARQARREVDSIGVGSLIGIFVLTFLAFRSIRPRLLVLLSILVGCLVAVASCYWVFGKVHILTLVFGASLIGVAENYGTNYFVTRQGRAPELRIRLLRQQAPLLWLAMATTALGYVALAVPPFPGLRQMAVFATAGLVGSFLTVMCWFTLIDRGAVATSRLSGAIAAAATHWPRFGANRIGALAGAALLLLILWLVSLIRVSDDVRSLQNAPAALVSLQREVNLAFGLPSLAQFVLVAAADPEALLEREEDAADALAAAQGGQGGITSVASWVPSKRRQDAVRSLRRQRIDGAQGVRAEALTLLGQDLVTDAPAAAMPPLMTLPDWLAAPASEPFRSQVWTTAEGQTTTWHGLILMEQPTASMRAAVAALKGVSWIDSLADTSGLLGRYRKLMNQVLIASIIAVAIALWPRFRGLTVKALAPTLLAGLIAWLLPLAWGEPLQLFNTLALFIILGMGIDYAIFMLDQPMQEHGRQFVSVTLGALATMLSFGLLSLSSTPALHAFGETMGIGIFLAWLLTPVFCVPRVNP